MLEDRILIWKFNRGSTDALRAIYLKYRIDMLTVATALCNDVHLAEDSVQDCFVAFAGAAGKLKLRDNLKGYLITSVVNRVRDYQRAGRRQPQKMSEPDIQSLQTDSGPEATAVCNEDLLRLSGALARLPDEQRQAVVLHTRGQLTYRQIAALQNVSIPTVQRRYHFGLEQLRVLLNGELET